MVGNFQAPSMWDQKLNSYICSVSKIFYMLWFLLLCSLLLLPHRGYIMLEISADTKQYIYLTVSQALHSFSSHWAEMFCSFSLVLL